MITRILVAVDDSPAALAAARCAVALATDLRCDLLAVTVLRDHLFDQQIAASPGQVRERREQAATATLRHVRKLAQDAGVRVETVRLSGTPVTEVLGLARRSAADLVVISRASRTGPGAPYIGSEAQRMLEFSDVPVLVVPPGR